MGNLVYEATPEQYDEQRAALAGEPGIIPPLSVSSNALANSIIVKSGAGTLYGITVMNTKAAAQFLQWYDLNALPADGAVPAGVVDLPASSARGISWLDIGRAFTSGIILCNSTTAATKTIGLADCFFDVQYL